MHQESKTIVIVGAGQAGAWAARTLRDEGFDGRLVLIGDEVHTPYERPPLSKAILAGEEAPQAARLLDEETLDALSIEWLAGVRVVRVDRANQHIILAGDAVIRYDKLILTTGGRARTLSVPGATLPGVHTLRTIDDALRLEPLLRRDARIAVVGGGWIGLEVAAMARQRGAIVTVVETSSRLCERSVPETMSESLLSLHVEHGAEVKLSTEVTGFSPAEAGGLSLTLRDGSTVLCDAAVVGVGLIPNDELASEAGLECAGGVLVDGQCRTSDPNIFAAGDVAVTYNSWAGRSMRLESWQNAQEQGIAAARSALGHDVHYDPLPWFWSEQHGVNYQIYGVPLPSHQVVVRGDPAIGSYVLLFLEGERVVAALGANAGRELRFARRLIEKRSAVDPRDLANPDVSLAKLGASSTPTEKSAA